MKLYTYEHMDDYFLRAMRRGFENGCFCVNSVFSMLIFLWFNTQENMEGKGR